MTDFCKTRLYLNIYTTLKGAVSTEQPLLLAPFHFNFRNKSLKGSEDTNDLSWQDIIFTIYKLYNGKSCCIILNKLN